MNLKFVIAYDGSCYQGSQKQPNGLTVENKLLKAFKEINIETSIVLSGRTDKEVHATGQVFNCIVPDFWTDFKKLKEGLNGGLVNTEYPSKDWLLSEIFVLFITNSDEVRKITNYEDSLYITDDITVSNYQLDKIKDIYNKSDSLLNFRKLSLKVLE